MNSSCPGSVNLTSSQCNSIIKSGNHSLSDTDSENSLEIGLRCSTEQNIIKKNVFWKDFVGTENMNKLAKAYYSKVKIKSDMKTRSKNNFKPLNTEDLKKKNED
mmetsp:Transcript_20422/g.28730  ORF Transcript_20422/g.28730 Transcript_20422/m.28730 type:complete len:104 (+) Transcript_20422:2185-2496(+)